MAAANSDAGADLRPAGPKRLLDALHGCPDAMFQQKQLSDDFDSQASLDANWNWKNDGRYPPPVLGSGSLSFGPNNLNPAEWWNNWTPLESLQSFGDVLYCVRYRITPGSGLVPGDSTFETSLRGNSAGMALGVSPIDGVVKLYTRTSDTTFVQHKSAPLALNLDVEQTIEVAMWAHGSHFYVETKNIDSDTAVAMAVDDPALPSQGIVAMLGWRLKNALFVDRAVVGAPSSLASQMLADK